MSEGERQKLVEDTEKRVKGELCKQIDEYQQQFMQEREQLVSQIHNLEREVETS